MTINSNTRALVTGASSGIGQALAASLAEAGAQVLAVGRDSDRLNATAAMSVSGQIVPIIADLTSAEDRIRVIQKAQDQFGRLDLLVNCAGVGAYGHFDTHDESVLRRIFEINFFAVAELTRAALPLLRESPNRPTVLNVGSIVARRALPARPEYSASKFALAGLTEALRSEWVRYGIHVMMVNPGFTNTPFEDHLLANTAVYQTQSWRSSTARQVAQSILKAVAKQRNEVTLTLKGKLLVLINRLFPRLVDRGLARFTLKLYPDSPALQKNKKSNPNP